MRGLRIALTADPYIPVPPRHYGGIERVVDFLVRGLQERGHRVTLFAHPDSQTGATLIPYGVPPHTGMAPRMRELWQVGSEMWRRRADFDIIHSFGRLAALLPILPLRSLPKVQSYQRDAVPWTGVKRAVRLAGNSLRFTACSTSVYRDRPRNGRATGQWQTVANGVDLRMYEFSGEVNRDAPLVFLGRLEPIKGAHHAIAIARMAKRRLVIAGNTADRGPHAEYFQREIAPHIDGDAVTYVGPVDNAQKNRLLGASVALLMSIDWEEPFGIVMVEAMACGTPVIAFSHGSVPEVVRHGVTGYICRTVEEAARMVAALGSIDRRAVRRDCQARFSAEVIVNEYERLYVEMVGA